MKKQNLGSKARTRLAVLLLLTLCAAGLTMPAGQAEEDPVVLTLGFQSDSYPDGIQSSPIFDKITEETGVIIDFMPYSVEKYKLLVAGGDLPDITTCLESHVSGITKQLINAGQIIPLDDLLAEYGQNITNNIPLALRWAKEVQGEGTTYTLPRNCTAGDRSAPAPRGNITFEIRWDIYEALGKPEIDGDEGLLDFAEAAMNAFPTSPQGYKTYAFSSHISSGAIWPMRYSWPRAHEWYWAPNFHYVNMLTGELQSMFTDPDGAFWDSLEFYNKAFQRGLFDPEGLTMTSEQYTEKVETGQVLITFANYWPSPDPEIVGETLFVKLPGYIPYLHILYELDNPIGDQASHARAITTNCEYPEKAMQLLNYFDSAECARMFYNGMQGVDWDYVDGVPQYIGEYAQVLQSGEGTDYLLSKYGMSSGSMTYNMISGTIIDAGDGYSVNLKQTAPYYAMFTPEVEKNWAKGFNPDFEYVGQVYEMWYEEGLWTTAFEIPLATNLMAPLDVKYTDIQARVESYFNDNLAKVIMAGSDEAFQAAKAEFLAKAAELGALEADAEVLRLYEEAKELERIIRE